MDYGLTLPPPPGPVNPAEEPIAAHLLRSMHWDLLCPTRHNEFYLRVTADYPLLREEIHQHMRLGPFRGTMAVAH
jgi:hypothetical protein